jgi:hypothetical protein
MSAGEGNNQDTIGGQVAMPVIDINGKSLLEYIKQMTSEEFEAFLEEAVAVRKAPKKNTSSAEEIEPTVEFNWSKARTKVRAAAKAYSEQTHADY